MLRKSKYSLREISFCSKRKLAPDVVDMRDVMLPRVKAKTMPGSHTGVRV
jgi:hypothetical protein